MKFEDIADTYPPLWKSIKFRPGWKTKADRAAAGIVKDRPRYQTVAEATGVPWFVVGLIHQMESDRNFKTHLHNGDPLKARTVHVPAGRPLSGHPPFDWTDSAIDALRMQKLQSIMAWPLPRICYELERYNGFGTRLHHHKNTPYLWSGTNHYDRGKYVKDGVWSDTAVSKQVGALAVLLSLTRIDKDVAAALKAPLPQMPELPAPEPVPGPAPTPTPTPGKPPVAGRNLDLREIQQRLSTLPFYPPAQVDGDYGPLTQAALQGFLMQQGEPTAANWHGSRLVIAGAQALCRLDDIEVGEVDGILGPQTRYAFDVYAGRKSGDKSPENWRDKDEDKPPNTPPPAKAVNWPRQQGVPAFFGARGENQTRLTFPYPMRLAWQPDTIVKTTSCHTKVRDAAARVLKRVLDHYGEAKIRDLRLDYYGGCLNVRRIRGGTGWSMHSWGIAFDFDPDRNQLKWDHTRAAFAKPAYNKWFEFWEEEGAISLGRARDYDWMHVQFARL